MIERGNPERKLDRWKDILYFRYIVTNYKILTYYTAVMSFKKGKKNACKLMVWHLFPDKKVTNSQTNFNGYKHFVLYLVNIYGLIFLLRQNAVAFTLWPFFVWAFIVLHKLGVKGIIPRLWIIRERESQRAAQGESVYILQIHPAAEITDL